MRKTIPVIVAALALAACASRTPAPSTGTAAIARSGTAASSGRITYGSYRRVVKDGVEYFCEKPTTTGSHVPSRESCITRADLKAQGDKAQDFMRRSESSSTLSKQHGG